MKIDTSSLASEISRELARLGILSAHLPEFLHTYARNKGAGCPWGCSGHNQPKHNKVQ